MGVGSKKQILYMIDLGLCKRYREAQSHKHIPFKDGRGMMGTVRYSSINSQSGNEQSRRDDLEAVGYVLVYLLQGIEFFCYFFYIYIYNLYFQVTYLGRV
jgi:serine/threonine protein kinase